MLSGVEVTFGLSVLISIVGMLVVLCELALIACFILILSKIVGKIASGKKADAVPVPAAAAPVPVPAADNAMDEEMIALMTVVIEESGHKPEEIVFKSIKKL